MMDLLARRYRALFIYFVCVDYYWETLFFVRKSFERIRSKNYWTIYLGVIIHLFETLSTWIPKTTNKNPSIHTFFAHIFDNFSTVYTIFLFRKQKETTFVLISSQNKYNRNLSILTLFVTFFLSFSYFSSNISFEK